MFVDVLRIQDWMTLKYDSNRFKSKSLTQNIARLCVKKDVLAKVRISDIAKHLEDLGIPESDITFTTTFVTFALPFSVDKDKDFNEKIIKFSKQLCEYMIKKYALLLEKRDNLQTMIIELLKKSDYRLKASIYFAAKFGHENTFDLLERIDNVWS